MSLSPCPTFAQAARQSRCAPRGEGRGGGPGQHAQHGRATYAVTAARGLLSTFKAMERTPRLHVHAGRLGGERGGSRGRLPGDCNLGAGPREDKLAAVTRRQTKALGLDSGGKKVLEEMKEQSRPSLCPYRVSPYLSCVTDRHKTIPKTARSVRHTRGTEGRSPGCGGEAGGWVSWLCTRWHERCTRSSSWKPAALGVWSAGFGSFLS